MRATRDRLRRRNFLTRMLADMLSHIQNTNSQYNMEPFGANIVHKANRQDIADQFLDPDVRMSRHRADSRPDDPLCYWRYPSLRTGPGLRVI